MTDWVKRPDIDSEADEDTVVWLAVRQLQREVDALKVKAAPTPGPGELVDQDAAMEALQKEYVALRSEMYGVQSDLRGKVKENAELRARCERLRDYALAEYAYVELLERGHTERIPGTMAKTSRWVSEAHDRLQPGHLAALDAAEEGR